MLFLPPRGLLAVLAVTDIALNASQRPLSARTLAARYNLAPRYLEPMLQMLAQVGILKGVRGPHGGYRLARPAAELTVESIFRVALAFAADPHPFLGKNLLVANVIMPSLGEAEPMLADMLSSMTIEKFARRAAELGLTQN
jgi:Rrf2 family protein